MSLKTSLSIAIAIAGLFYAVAGYPGSADMFGDHPRWRGMNKGPRDFGLSGETVSFHSIDGVHLKAWWLPASGTPRAAIVVAHGIDHTRQVMLPRAVFLVKGGYNVLLIDLRGHGESGGSIVSPGLLEARDVPDASAISGHAETTNPLPFWASLTGQSLRLLPLQNRPMLQP